MEPVPEKRSPQVSRLGLTADEMPRERLLALGPSALKTEELLAILFRTGVSGCDVLTMSHKLLDSYGGLKNLARATVAELTSGDVIKGLGTAKAVTLLAAIELGKRAVDEEDRDGSLRGSLMRWAHELALDEREYIVAIYLDAKDRPIAADRISYGGTDGAALDASYLMRRAVRLDCSSLVLMHNHPNGSTVPSQDDMYMTEQIRDMLEVLAIRFYGHYIAASGRPYRIKKDGGTGRDVMRDLMVSAPSE